MRFRAILVLCLALPLPIVAQSRRFEVTIAAPIEGPITGRLIVALSKTKEPEPRLAVSPSGPALFAVDLDQAAPGRPIAVDEKSLGYPVGLAEIPAGDYFVQAVVNVYHEMHRADGHTIWVPFNDGRIE